MTHYSLYLKYSNLTVDHGKPCIMILSLCVIEHVINNSDWKKNQNRDRDEGDRICRLIDKNHLVNPNKSDFEENVKMPNKISKKE